MLDVMFKIRPFNHTHVVQADEILVTISSPILISINYRSNDQIERPRGRLFTLVPRQKVNQDIEKVSGDQASQ